MQSYREFLCSDIADTAKNKLTIGKSFQIQSFEMLLKSGALQIILSDLLLKESMYIL